MEGERRIDNMDLTCRHPNMLESYQQMASLFSTKLRHHLAYHISYLNVNCLPNSQLAVSFMRVGILSYVL